MFVHHVEKQVCRSSAVSTQCQTRPTELRLYRLYNY